MNTTTHHSLCANTGPEDQRWRNGTNRSCGTISGNPNKPLKNATKSPRARFFSDCAATRDAISRLDWATNGFKIDISLVSPGFKQVGEFNRRMIQQQTSKHCRRIDQLVQEVVLGRRKFRSGKIAMPSVVIPERWSRMKDGTPSVEIPLHYHAAFLMTDARTAQDIVDLLESKISSKLIAALRPCSGFGDRFDQMDVHIQPINPGESCKAIAYANKYAYDLIEHAAIRLP